MWPVVGPQKEVRKTREEKERSEMLASNRCGATGACNPPENGR